MEKNLFLWETQEQYFLGIKYEIVFFERVKNIIERKKISFVGRQVFNTGHGAGAFFFFPQARMREIGFGSGSLKTPNPIFTCESCRA